MSKMKINHRIFSGKIVHKIMISMRIVSWESGELLYCRYGRPRFRKDLEIDIIAPDNFAPVDVAGLF